MRGGAARTAPGASVAPRTAPVLHEDPAIAAALAELDAAPRHVWRALRCALHFDPPPISGSVWSWEEDGSTSGSPRWAVPLVEALFAWIRGRPDPDLVRLVCRRAGPGLLALAEDELAA